MQAGTCTKEKGLVAKKVVSTGAVSTARADETMVPINIDRVAAERALELTRENWQAKSTLHHNAEVLRVGFGLKSIVGHCMQPLS